MKVLLAVSGGIDSMYMLHRAPELFPGASFAVAHCNFGLRGEESDGDEAFVQDACKTAGIDCFVRRFNTAEYASEHGISIEMAARELRYSWFRELCTTEGFDALATAHNANDNAETLILNLLRGSGSKGLRGMKASQTLRFSTIPLHPQGTEGRSPQTPPKSAQCASEFFPNSTLCHIHLDSGVTESGRGSKKSGRPWPLEWEGPAGPEEQWEGWNEVEVFRASSCAVEPLNGLVLLRPLLEINREDIRRWMEEKGYQWREDKTNGENEARRNKIRNLVFPVFAEINPSFVKTLGEDMARIRQTDDIADDYFREAAERIVRQSDNALEISVMPLIELKHWRYVLWRLLEDCSFNAETFGKLCALLERYRSEPLGTVTLSGKTFQSPTHILKARRKVLVLSAKL